MIEKKHLPHNRDYFLHGAKKFESSKDLNHFQNVVGALDYRTKKTYGNHPTTTYRKHCKVLVYYVFW